MATGVGELVVDASVGDFGELDIRALEALSYEDRESYLNTLSGDQIEALIKRKYDVEHPMDVVESGRGIDHNGYEIHASHPTGMIVLASETVEPEQLGDHNVISKMG